MDGSRRSTHGNAYFIGIGANKRIVLFDTLVDELEVPQAVAVLAHEIGHSKRGHIRKSLVLSLFLTLVGFWLLHQLMLLPEFFAAFGFTQPSNHAALAIFSFAATPFIYFLSPLTSMLSRKFEYEADRYAIDLVGNATDLSMALLTLSKRSLSNLTPHPLYSFFHYSHPTLAERLRAMQLYSGGA